MKTSKIIRALPVLPVAWVSSKIYEKKSQLEAQVRLEKWSRFILKYSETAEAIPLSFLFYPDTIFSVVP